MNIIKFEDMYNGIAQVFEECKNISWHKIRKKYLSQNPRIPLN